MLFQGEEWGASTPFQYFTDHTEPEFAKAVREGRRKEYAAFGWKPKDIPDPQALDTFLRSKLRWDELSREPHSGLLEWHRQFIRLRQREPALLDDRLEAVQTRLDESVRWLAVERGPLHCSVAPFGACPMRPGPRGRTGALAGFRRLDTDRERRRNDAARLGLRLTDSFLIERASNKDDCNCDPIRTEMPPPIVRPNGSKARAIVVRRLKDIEAEKGFFAISSGYRAFLKDQPPSGTTALAHGVFSDN